MRPGEVMQSLEETRSEIIRFTNELDELLAQDEIDDMEYKILLNEKLQGKTKEELISYIDVRIAKEKEKIERKNKEKKTRRKVLMEGATIAFVLLAFAGFLLTYDGSMTGYITATNTTGNYSVKVNATYSSMSAEATGTLTIQSHGGSVNCTAYKCFITRSNGNLVAIFDALGALDLKATIVQSASGSPEVNDFIIRNSTATPIAWINASGNLIIKGTLSKNNGVACNTPASSFFIREKNSECVAYVNASGGLWLKGDLRENVLT
jgi:hypothetical protein